MNDKISRAIEVLRENEPKDGKGYGLAFSGGKDSIVIKQLAIESGVKFKAFYSVTTIDPPELMRYIKREHSDVEWLKNPKGSFFKRLVEHGAAPSFYMRWCCNEFKERNLNEFSAKIIGVRKAESVRRAKRWDEVVEDNRRANAIIERWHNVVVEKPTPHPHYSSRFKSGEEWFLYSINRGHPEDAQETCQMELMFTGGSEKGGAK